MKDIHFHEYEHIVPGKIQPGKPKCPYIAVIPSLTVEDINGIKNLANCFVHVSNINKTFYIDDKHRMIITWGGPVEVNDYDYEVNPLKLRSQTVYDFKNNRAIYYNKIGEYRIITLGV